MTSTAQYGYKKGISTIDAIHTIDQFAQENNPESKTILMDLTIAFSTINRTQLWATIYKKMLPLANTVQIIQGRQKTTLRAKTKGGYGEAKKQFTGYPKAQPYAHSRS